MRALAHGGLATGDVRCRGARRGTETVKSESPLLVKSKARARLIDRLAIRSYSSAHDETYIRWRGISRDGCDREIWRGEQACARARARKYHVRFRSARLGEIARNGRGPAGYPRRGVQGCCAHSAFRQVRASDISSDFAYRRLGATTPHASPSPRSSVLPKISFASYRILP